MSLTELCKHHYGSHRLEFMEPDSSRSVSLLYTSWDICFEWSRDQFIVYQFLDELLMFEHVIVCCEAE